MVRDNKGKFIQDEKFRQLGETRQIGPRVPIVVLEWIEREGKTPKECLIELYLQSNPSSSRVLKPKRKPFVPFNLLNRRR